MSKFQYYKENNEIIRGLKPHVKKELFKWQSKFPVFFFQELFRLNGWDFNTAEIKKKSNTIGTWVNTLVYDELPNNILTDLEEKEPRMEVGSEKIQKEKLITRDIGNSHLQSQINQVITLFQVSDNMKNMWEKFMNIKNKQNDKSLKPPFEFDENGHTVNPIKKEKLSDFNEKLLKGLNWNPKDNKK